METIKRTKIVDVLKSDAFGTTVNVKGWVRTRRGSKQVNFIALNDGSTINNVQIVVDVDKLGDEFLKPITWNSLQDVDAHRKIIFEAIVKYRKMKNQGVVAVFKRDRFDRYSNFARIGDGSLGGKGRGLAFIDNMVKRHPEF